MNPALKTTIDDLNSIIRTAYEESVTVEEAERLATRFLHAMLAVAEELRVTDLDFRMRKSGLKAIKGAVYMEAATKDPKKPSDVMLGALVDMSELVQGEQGRCDEAEVQVDYLRSCYNVFKEAHIHMRGIAKGSFSG